MSPTEKIRRAEEKLAKARARRERADQLACEATARLSDAEEAECRARTELREARAAAVGSCGWCDRPAENGEQHGPGKCSRPLGAMAAFMG